MYINILPVIGAALLVLVIYALYSFVCFGGVCQ